MDDNFKHRLKNWVDKREAQNRMRMKDITHVVDPGRIIPKEDKEVEDHNYYSKKIREYIQKRLEQQAVNKSEELEKKIFSYEEILDIDNKYSPSGSLLYGKFAKYHKPGTQYKILNIPIKRLYTNEKLDEDDYQKEHKNYPGTEREFPHQKMWYEDPEDSDEFRAKDYLKKYPKGSTAQPIIVHPDSEGKYMILDGRHRARAAYLRGEKSIRAFVPINLPQAVNKSEELDKGAKGDWQKEGYSLKYNGIGDKEMEKEKKVISMQTPPPSVIEHILDTHMQGKSFSREFLKEWPIKRITKGLINWGKQNGVFTENTPTVGIPTQEHFDISDLAKLKNNILKNPPKEISSEETVDSDRPIWEDHHFSAYSPNGKEVGKYIFQINYKQPKIQLSANNTWTHPDHQRKGLANAAYSLAEKTFKTKMLADTTEGWQSEDAKKFWAQPNRPFGKKEELDKGAKGDWQKEGYTISHSTHINNKDGDGDHTSVYAYHNGNKVGRAKFYHYDKTLYPADANIHPSHQRKGLATAMYQHAENVTGKKIEPSESQTRSAEKLWSQKNRPFGKSEELDKGAKGDWQKEGYKLEYKQDDFENEPPRKSVTITAKDHNDNIVGEYKFSHHPNFKWVVPEDVYTHKDHVRKGLATAAYSLAEKITGKIADRSGGQSQTEDAKAFWSQTNRPFGKTEEFDALKKGAKELKAMYGSSITPEQESFVGWATSKLPNSNWQEWAVKNHAKNPQQFDQESIKNIEHFAGSKHIPNIAKVRFDKHDIKQGLEAFKTAEDEYNKKALANPQLIKPSEQTTKFIDVGDNYAWYMLNKPACEAEGAAMGHCGNVPSQQEGQNVLSLRERVKVGDKEYHKPVATFILQPDGKTIGEMKGRANLIPQPKYHKYIKQLLERSDLLPEGGGYLPGNNFHLDDLSHEEHDDLLAKRPELALYSNRISLEQQKDLMKDYRNHKRLSKNPNLHHDLQMMLAQPNEYQPGNFKLRLNLARYSKHPKIQDKLLRSGIDEIIENLARNPNLHPEIQAKLYKKNDDSIIEDLAKNPNLHPKVQKQLAQSKNVHILRQLAKNKSLYPETQIQLAQSKDLITLGTLSENKNIHPDLQKQLFKDKRPFILNGLAQNPKLITEIQKQLIQSKDLDTLSRLARNRNLHPDLQKQLTQNQNSYLLQQLAINPKIDKQIQKQVLEKIKSLDPEKAENVNNDLKLNRLKIESKNSLKARKARVKDYFERFK